MAGLFNRLLHKFRGGAEIDWDELEADLVMADLGVKRAMEIVTSLRERRGVTPETVFDGAKEILRNIFPAKGYQLDYREAGLPTVITVVGVNGTGKTTSCAKLAHSLSKRGNEVLLVAADTFRAAAVEQLEFWANKLHVPLYKGVHNQDPASVCFEAHAKAIKNGTDFIICDTAGRLHTRHNLMEELAKIRRTIAKQDATAPHYNWIVVDATTGANALAQARAFNQATPLNGAIITKMDGSAKGGIAVALMDEMQLQPAYVGTGEGAGDFKPFNRNTYVDELL